MSLLDESNSYGRSGQNVEHEMYLERRAYIVRRNDENEEAGGAILSQASALAVENASLRRSNHRHCFVACHSCTYYLRPGQICSAKMASLICPSLNAATALDKNRHPL